MSNNLYKETKDLTSPLVRRSHKDISEERVFPRLIPTNTNSNCCSNSRCCQTPSHFRSIPSYCLSNHYRSRSSSRSARASICCNYFVRAPSRPCSVASASNRHSSSRTPPSHYRGCPSPHVACESIMESTQSLQEALDTLCV